MLIKVRAKPLFKVVDKKINKLLKNQRTFGDFSVKKDLPYIDDESELHLLDLVEPVLNHENGITLLYVHGGAYFSGVKEDCRIFTSWFANQGFKVVSLNYRLVDVSENIDIEDQVRDVVEAIKYIYEYRHEHKIDFNKFCLMGDSAGGHICLLVDLIFRYPELRESFGVKDLPDISIKCLGLNSTMYDFETLIKYASKYLNKKGLREVFGKRYLNNDFISKNSPRNYVQEGYKFDSIFNSTSYKDEFYFQSFRLKKDTKEYDLDVYNYFEPSARKQIGHVYNHFIFDDEGLKCNLSMVEFFKKHCDVE